MRLVVMFDIPNSSPSLRRQYGTFRKHLIAEGFSMEQFSVYSRPVATREACSALIARMRPHLPEAGRVTVLELTEKQYARRHQLVGRPATVATEGRLAQLTLLL